MGKTATGRTAIVEAFQGILDETEWALQSAPLMVFEVDEVLGTASGRVTVHERFKKRKTAKPATMLATYHDQYVRHGGAWLFVDRRLEVIERG
jgi:hypothetical protein